MKEHRSRQEFPVVVTSPSKNRNTRYSKMGTRRQDTTPTMIWWDSVYKSLNEIRDCGQYRCHVTNDHSFQNYPNTQVVVQVQRLCGMRVTVIFILIFPVNKISELRRSFRSMLCRSIILLGHFNHFGGYQAQLTICYRVCFMPPASKMCTCQKLRCQHHQNIALFTQTSIFQ